MVVLGEVLRAIDITLIVAYFPVLYLRFSGESQTQRIYLVGMIFLLFGILSNSIILFNQPFRGASLFVLIGLLLIWAQTFHNIRNE